MGVNDDDLVRLGRTIRWAVEDAGRILGSVAPDVALLLQELRRRGKLDELRAVEGRVNLLRADLPGVVVAVDAALVDEVLAVEMAARAGGGGGARSTRRGPPRSRPTRRRR